MRVCSANNDECATSPRPGTPGRGLGEGLPCCRRSNSFWLFAPNARTTPHPAYGLDRLWTACCGNGPAEALFCGWLDGAHQRNLLRFVFLEEAARSLIPNWQDRARRLLAEFRADFGHNFRDAQVTAFIDELKAASPLFARTWDDQDVQHRLGGPRTFDHPERGRLRFEQHSFSPSERPDHKLVLLIPVPAGPQPHGAGMDATPPAA